MQAAFGNTAYPARPFVSVSAAGCIGGLPMMDAESPLQPKAPVVPRRLLVAVTEKRTTEEIDRLAVELGVC
jgi:hypothetical protein